MQIKSKRRKRVVGWDETDASSMAGEGGSPAHISMYLYWYQVGRQKSSTYDVLL